MLEILLYSFSLCHLIAEFRLKITFLFIYRPNLILQVLDVLLGIIIRIYQITYLSFKPCDNFLQLIYPILHQFLLRLHILCLLLLRLNDLINLIIKHPL